MTSVLRRVSDGYTYAGDTDLSVMTCPACGITYAIPQRLQEHAYEKGNHVISWYCPNGHSLSYPGKSEAEKAKESLAFTRQRLTAERELREHTERKLTAQKGATTKAKKRHAAGVCPCCNRSFSQLKRHMAAKHAEYLEQHGIPTSEPFGEVA